MSVACVLCRLLTIRVFEIAVVIDHVTMRGALLVLGGLDYIYCHSLRDSGIDDPSGFQIAFK